MRYEAPKAGYYQISAKITRYEPTGKFETVPNPNRMWFQFWKPKTVTREIFTVKDILEGQQVKFLKQGEVVDSEIFTRLSP